MLTHKKENPMAIRSKNALSSSLLKLMMYKSFDEISISDITERAGLSRQTFYTNFQKKEDILLYLLHRLFQRYYDKLSAAKPVPENLIIDYFIFWGDSRDFLSLLFNQNMGFLFQDCNRAFFVEDTDIINDMFTAEPWQLPYVKASLAGVTYELLLMWITKDQGLSVDVLNSMTVNLLGGKIFA
ncbi:MAG: TetR/AcrR family transcriptional regulator [Oscillospiraceae bacterium]